MMDKTQLRRRILARRSSLSQQERRVKSEKICRLVSSLPAYREATCVMLYLDFRGEVETTSLALDILQDGKRLVIPYCIQKETQLLACEIFNLEEDLASGMLGIREPHPQGIRPISPREIDLVLAPGVAFDLQGNRLGYGKGYYDRFLPRLKAGTPLIGLAYAVQVIEEIPSDFYDVKMSLLITENGVRYPLKKKSTKDHEG